MDSWIPKQIDSMLLAWEGSIEKHYPQHLKTWKNPEEQVRCLREEWNTMEAMHLIDWNVIMPKVDVDMMDMGCGTGWLSAELSKRSSIRKIIALDYSRFNLEMMLPEVVRLLGGDLARIQPVQGMFFPLQIKNQSLDLVVASSAVHHADGLNGVLSEAYRVIKPGGHLILLNETPASSLRYMYNLCSLFTKTLWETINQSFQTTSPSLSSSGILYDPLLGDRNYALWYWKKSLFHVGFRDIRVLDTGLTIYKKKSVGQNLTHFICKKD
jgi:SAM-dependent methyltransferase